jgi:hypothetical protein
MIISGTCPTIHIHIDLGKDEPGMKLQRLLYYFGLILGRKIGKLLNKIQKDKTDIPDTTKGDSGEILEPKDK